MAESKTNCISPGLNTLDSDCATAHNGVTDGHHTDSSLIKKETHLGYAHSVFIKTESVNFVDLAHVTHLHPDQIKTETADGGCIETEQIRALQDMKCIDIEFDDVKLESSEVSDLMTLVSEEVFKDPTLYIEELKRIPIPEDLSAQPEEPAMEEVNAGHASQCSPGAAGTQHTGLKDLETPGVFGQRQTTG
ncbi:hypothetical protein GJAV_G00086920 [Gymnothorax javanicus]|nr:hypothetical protein GJAV_G00086920 [Gymnothorax javanicus]